MSTETPTHGAPGRTNDTVLKEQRENSHESAHVISTNKSTNGIPVKAPSTNDATLIANNTVPITDKNGRSTGDTSNSRSGEHGHENTAQIPVPTESTPAVASSLVGGNMNNPSRHDLLMSNSVGANGTPQANATMIDAAITLDNTFTPHNSVDKLLAPQSTSLFSASLDPKLPGSAVMHAASTPAMPSKFLHGAAAYGSNGNFGATPQSGYEDALMAPAMLTASSGYQNGFHVNGSHMEVEHNSYGSLFQQGAANSSVGGMGSDFAGPSQAPMNLAPHLYPSGRYGMGGAAAAPAATYTTRLGEQGMFGYPLGHMSMAQRTDVTPHTLMGLDDALDRNTTTRSPHHGDEEEIVPVVMGTGGTSGSASGITGESLKKGSRRKGARGGRKADETDLRVLSKKAPPRTRTMHSSAHMSAEEKRRIRAERNRESAEKSRLRHKQRTEELERDVYHKRIENREVKASIDTYYAQLRGVADTIEKGTSREEAVKKVPALYNALNSMSKAIEQCVWTYRDPREPEIQLKIGRP